MHLVIGIVLSWPHVCLFITLYIYWHPVTWWFDAIGDYFICYDVGFIEQKNSFLHLLFFINDNDKASFLCYATDFIEGCKCESAIAYAGLKATTILFK